MKKFLSMVLVLATLVALSPIAALAATTDIGWIKTSTDSGSTWNFAPEFNDSYGHRIWMSSAKAWFPASQWDTRFSAKQKKVYETGWVQTIIYIPDNVMSRVFCYSWKQDEEIHPACVMTLSSGTYRMDILNGEAQNWRSGSDSAENDLGRIWDQIMTGNLNVRPELDIALVTADLLDKIPEGIVNYIGVTEGPVADQ